MFKVAEGYQGAHNSMNDKQFCLICGHKSAQIKGVRSGSHTEVATECPNCKARGKISNATEYWYGTELTKEEVESIFTLAKIKIFAMKQTQNGYMGDSRPDQYGERQFWHYWWFVKTKHGWIEIGWRKRVISIDWVDTHVRAVVPSPHFEGRTRDNTGSHAYGVQEAISDLTFWNEQAERTG